MRIFVTYAVICETNVFSIVLALGTAILKICVGIVQIMVILEIWLKVRENEKLISQA